MAKKLLTGFLVSAMLLAYASPMVSAQEEVNEPTEYMTDLTAYYNADTLFREGEPLDDTIWYNQNNMDKPDSILSTLNGESVLLIDEAIVKENSGDDGAVTYTEEKTGRQIPFLMSTDALRSNKAVTDEDPLRTGKDVVVIKNRETGGDVTIPVEQKRVQNLYFIIDACHKSVVEKGLDVEVNYLDGTVDYKHITLANSMDSSIAGKAGTDYAGRKGFWNKRVMPGTNEDDKNTAVIFEYGSGACWMEFTMLKIGARTDKKLESVTFKPINLGGDLPNYSAYLYGITAVPMSSADMTDEINGCTIDEATEDNVSEIIKLNEYADELIERGAAEEADFAKIRELKKQAEFFLNMVDPTEYTWNIKPYFNKDTIANSGDVLGENWLTLSDENNIPGSFIKSQLTGKVKYIDEQIISGNETDGYVWQDTGKDIPFAFDEESLSGGVNDAIVLDSTIDNGEITIDAETAGANELAKEVYMLVYPGSYGQLTVNISYTDGTKSSDTISVRHGREAATLASYTNTAGFWYIGGWQKIQNTDGVATLVSGEPSLNLFKLYIDPTRVPEKITFAYKEGWGSTRMTIYSITSIPMSNAELKDFIAQTRTAVETDGYVTEENTEIAKNAKVYLDELIKRSAAKEEDYKDIVSYASQAAGQEEIYVSGLPYDTDIFALPGDTADIDITDNIVSLQRIADVNGFVELKEPANSEFIDEETGRKFKMSGFHAGEDDSVLLQDKTFTLNIGGKIMKKIAAFIYYSPEEIHKNGMENVTINYSDGTKEEQSIPFYGCASWYTSQQNAHIGDYELAKDESGTWIQLGYAEGVSMPNVTSSVIKPSYMKPIDSVTYGANSEFIALAAVTEIPYTNDEYMNLVLEMEDVLYEVNDEVTEENAQLVFDGCSAVLDLIKRGYDMPAEETERYSGLKVLANNILNGESGEIIFEKPVITISDDIVKAEAKMKNTTSNGADYILILAAYDENGSLVGIKASAQSELAAGTQEYTESVSMSIAENAVSYKAFVWKDMQGIVPLAYGELL